MEKTQSVDSIKKYISGTENQTPHRSIHLVCENSASVPGPRNSIDTNHFLVELWLENLQIFRRVLRIHSKIIRIGPKVIW